MLDRLADQVAGGDSRVLVLRGDAGAGKTALLGHLSNHVTGWRVASAVGEGRIRISAGPTHGRELSYNIMEPCVTFGEIALLDGGPRTASATASEATDLVSIRRDHLFALLEREPKVALELLKLCGTRLRWTSGLVEDAFFLDAPARLAKRLLSLAELHGQRSKTGVTLKISQEDLATFLSVSRQVVNQHLQGWKAKGWVALGRGSVTVRDEGAIRQAARVR